MPIFISYSRQDSDFVRRLHRGLLSRDRETWVDWEGIPPTADWMKQIEAAIDAAEAFAFVLSPESLASTVCRRELDHADAQNKRVIPLVWRQADAAQVPPALARLNWIFFREEDDFETALQTLLSAVDTDLDWLQAHTRLLLRSREWEAKGRDGSLALRGGDLKAAEQWLTLGPRKAPQPTELQTRYIIDSRRQATNRRFLLLGAAAVSLVAIAILATLFHFQRQESARQEANAVARRLSSASERVREQRPAPGSASSPVEVSVQLAAEAVRRLSAVGARALEADLALRRALATMPQRIARLEAIAQPAERFDDIVFGAGGQLIAASRFLSTTSIWDSGSFQPAGGRQRAVSANSVVLSSDGQFLVTIEPGDLEGAIDVWRIGAAAPFASLRDPGRVQGIAIAPGGGQLVVTSSRYDATGGRERGLTRIVELPGGREIARLPRVLWPSFSRDGAHLAGLVGDDQPVIWAMARLRQGQVAPLVSLAVAAPLARAPLFSADGTQLAIHFGENPGRVGIWTVKDWKLLRELRREFPQALGPGARYLALRDDDSGYGHGYGVRIVDTGSDRDVARFTSESDFPALAFSPDGGDVAIASGKGIDVWRILGHGSDVARHAASEQAFALLFSADETRFGVLERDADGSAARVTANTWELAGSGARALVDLAPAASRFALSADGKVLALAAGGQVRVIDASSGKTRRSFALDGEATALSLSPDARYLAGASDRDTLQLWQVEPPQLLATIALAEPVVDKQLAVATDGQVVAVTHGSAGRIGVPLSLRVWSAPALSEIATRRVGAERSGLTGSVCALSADTRLVAINTADTAVTVRESSTGRDIGTVDEARGGRQCAFSADGLYLAVTGAEDSVRIWEIAAQTEVARLEHVVAPTALQFSPGGRYLATLEHDGTLRAWLLRPDDLLVEACSRLTRNIAASDWQRFLGKAPYLPACPKLPLPPAGTS